MADAQEKNQSQTQQIFSQQKLGNSAKGSRKFTTYPKWFHAFESCHQRRVCFVHSNDRFPLLLHM